MPSRHGDANNVAIIMMYNMKTGLMYNMVVYNLNSSQRVPGMTDYDCLMINVPKGTKAYRQYNNG